MELVFLLEFLELKEKQFNLTPSRISTVITYGVLQTSSPHNLIAGDTVFIDYTPVMNNTNKQFIVRQYKGIEEIVIDQNGSGYNTDIPPEITIVSRDGNGESGSLEAVVTSVGSIETINILILVLHIRRILVLSYHILRYIKKQIIMFLKLENQNYVKVNDVFVNDAKEVIRLW